ncbi:hypothetical protein Mgra_00003832 [Meloidogyne graminicola]|uniref:Secreted protein n=1 Tax=Meloidogyne graminicola TaxID=189291 RepID=A0A8S9ZTN3_9BILA|nr:hypothetical protein Mgra_00003832 [Meloidogyne graminicola]
MNNLLFQIISFSAMIALIYGQDCCNQPGCTLSCCSNLKKSKRKFRKKAMYYKIRLPIDKSLIFNTKLRYRQSNYIIFKKSQIYLIIKYQELFIQ